MNLATHPTWMELDRAALAHNLGEVRNRVGDGVRIIASVKANGYGHGIVPVAHVLAHAGVDMLATGSFAEALALRAAGVETPVLLLAGTLPEGMGDVLAQGFIPTIFDLAGARTVSRAATGPTEVFIKVDSGLGRVGVGLDAAQALLAEIAGLANVVVQGLYTHLSFHDADGMAYTKQRLALFYGLVERLKAAGVDIPITQALASSALLLGWRDDCTAVCPGHILFGLNPVTSRLADVAPFQPALATIKSRVIQVRDHAGGPEMGAGGYHGSRRQRRTAVAPCGLNDGYAPIGPGLDGVVLHGGHELRVIGVSLEHLTVEVPDAVHIAVGDELVIVAGDGPVALDRVAQWQSRRPIDALMAFSARMPVTVV
ncbi:MAG: alanine racemase [Alphaproteobacteria bacterium]